MIELTKFLNQMEETFPNRRKLRFKGGGPSKPEYPHQKNMGRMFKSETYASQYKALAGGGLMPADLQGQNRRDALDSIEEQYSKNTADFGRNMERMGMGEDDKVQKYGADVLNRSYQGAKTKVDSDIRYSHEMDQEGALPQMTEYLGEAKNLALQVKNIHDQGNAQARQVQARAGTMGSNIMSGYNSYMGSAMASKMYANQMNGNKR